jgi:hypothetical protein
MEPGSQGPSRAARDSATGPSEKIPRLILAVGIAFALATGHARADEGGVGFWRRAGSEA